MDQMKYKGWTIDTDPCFGLIWTATGPNYDAWTDDEGDWTDNGEKVSAHSYKELLVEIESYIEDQQ